MRILISINIVLAVVAAPLVAARTAHATDRPNVLFILVDDVGREVLGCYGGESYKTPNIDRLAESGMRFDHAYVMPMCHPTRICLMTGQYPFRLGEPRWGTFPKEFEHETLGNVFKQAAYATAISGKWQLALLKNDLRQPNRMGFDEYCLEAWHEGPWYYQPRIWQDGRLREDIHDRYGPDVTCDYLIDFLNEHANEHSDRPFFAYYTMELCHDETNDLDKPAPVGPLGRYDNYPERVALMDERIGRVMKALDETGLRDRTLVFVLADNGTPPKSLNDAKDGAYVFEEFTSRFEGRDVRGGKGTLTDWGTRVPMIASWPKKISPGRTDALVDASDVLPTLAEIAGAKIPAPEKMDGHSIANLLLHGGRGDRKWVFAEYNGRGFVRDHKWKLYSDGEFYDVASDIDEKSPLDTSQLPADASQAYQELELALNGLGYVNQNRTK